MPLVPVPDRSLADQIFEQLGGEIMTGAHAAGDVLPAERKLAESFGVNRHVVREALKRLEQVGLVKIAQGGGTRVLDYRKHAGLDLLAMLADHARGGAATLRLWLSVLEMRAAIGADAARLCARRASAEQRAELGAISQQMGEQAQDDAALYRLEVRFWDLVMDASGNVAYRLALNSMLRGAFAMGEAAQKWSADECRRAELRAPLVQAICRSDAEAAEQLTRTSLRAALDTLDALLSPSIPDASTKAR